MNHAVGPVIVETVAMSLSNAAPIFFCMIKNIAQREVIRVQKVVAPYVMGHAIKMIAVKDNSGKDHLYPEIEVV